MSIISGACGPALCAQGHLHPDDVARAVEAGVDGSLPEPRRAQADRAKPDRRIADAPCSGWREDNVDAGRGIRRGSDIVTALCLGASFCFVGRATLYGVAAGGPAARGARWPSCATDRSRHGAIGCATVPARRRLSLADADWRRTGCAARRYR
jgi:hypothetical protein